MLDRRRTFVTAVLTGVTVALAACGGEEEPAPAEEPIAEEPAAAEPTPAAPATAANLPAGVTQEMVQQGQQLFTGAGNCYTCHGPDATGTQLAPNLTDATWLWIPTDQPADQTMEALAQNVRTGVAQPKEHPAAMPPMGGAQLTDDQIQALAAYVYSIGNFGGGE